MKKLLFTLCAVLVGLSASALEAKYVNNSGEAVGNEVTMEPAKTLVLHVNVTGLETLVFGFQEQWVMRDVEGNDNAIEGSMVNIKKVGGKYFTGEGMSTFLETSLGNSTPDNEGEALYRIVAANLAYGFVWSPTAELAAARMNATVDELYGDYGCTEAMFTQGNVFRFTIQTSADWNEEYATLDFDQEYDKLSLDPAPNSAKLALPDLKIKNANWQAPLEDLTGEVTFTVDEATGKVNVNYSGNEDVTIAVTVNGQPVQFPYQLTDGVETTFDYVVTAEGYNPLTGSEKLTWTAPTPEQTEAPVITYTAENGTLTVTATGAEGDAIILNGPNNVNATGTTTATATVTYDPYVGYTGTWTATAQADGELVSEAASKAISVEAITPTVAVPEIQFVETKNANGEVTQVEVVVTNYTSYDVYVDGELLRGEVIEASTEAAKQIHVEAVNDPIANHSEFKKEAEDDYTLNKLRKDVVAPVITPATGADAVTVTITWPESDGEHMYDGQYSYPRTDEDYSVNVEAYTAQSANYNESAHATLTINVPKKEAAQQTGAPVFVNSPYTKPNQNAYFYQLANATEEPNAVIYYRVIDPDGNIVGATDENPEGWQVYTPGQEIGTYGANGGGKDGTWRVEAYAQAPGKAPSSVIAMEKSVGPTTGIDELIDGKAIANVRYFNMAGQEMQEANGMTIVVTTYTDGTTSAVKVMK